MGSRSYFFKIPFHVIRKWFHVFCKWCDSFIISSFDVFLKLKKFTNLQFSCTYFETLSLLVLTRILNDAFYDCPHPSVFLIRVS
jgi:hypothetical protein